MVRISDPSEVSVSRRLARLAGRGPPEVSGKRWRSAHVMLLPNRLGPSDHPLRSKAPRNSGAAKPGGSPSSDGRGTTWFISPWHSDGALRDETLPRVKVGAGAACIAEKPRNGQDPGAPQVQDGGRDTDGNVADDEADPSPTLENLDPTRSNEGSRAAG